MAFNTLEYLEEGKVDFVFRSTPYDTNSLIELVRNSERRDAIIDGFMPKLRTKLPNFCFRIIYDNPNYQKEASYMLHKYHKLKYLPKEFLLDIINKTQYGKRYLKEQLKNIIELYYNEFDPFFDCMFNNFNYYKDTLKDISLSNDMHLRFMFMAYVIDHYPEKLKYYYKDFCKYLYNYNYKKNEQYQIEPELMDIKDASLLGFKIFESPLKDELYSDVRDFLMTNYESNDLASHLLEYKRKNLSGSAYTFEENKEGIIEFCLNSDLYFKTARVGKITMYEHYSSLISNELLARYKKLLSYFKDDKNNLVDTYRTIDYYGLAKQLDEIVTKYLDLSKTDEHYFLASGSTSTCFRLGDYVVKLDRTKWSYEEIICPDLYIILPNLEEIFIRNEKGIVEAGIEVQKYLSRDAKNVPTEILGKLRDELFKLGYYSTDTLINGPCGDNCRLLDSYKDSGNMHPPKWFKEYPMVIVDRDRIYKKDNIYPKQLKQRY